MTENESGEGYLHLEPDKLYIRFGTVTRNLGGTTLALNMNNPLEKNVKTIQEGIKLFFIATKLYSRNIDTYDKEIDVSLNLPDRISTPLGVLFPQPTTTSSAPEKTPKYYQVDDDDKDEFR